MAKWRPMTENQKRQMKEKIKHVTRVGFVPRTKRQMSRNQEKSTRED